MPKYDVISFLSDMGTVDESVGVCKAIIYQQAPHVNIFDITHDVPAFDVRAGALALTRAIQFLPTGIVIAAVDPGSPRDQRYIAVELAEGILIGPDNGILAPAAQLIGEPKRVIHLSNTEYQIEAPGAVFAARDILAPAAGVIASGTDMALLGQEIPLEQLVPGMLQLSRHDEGGAFLGEVWSVDRFGNVQLNITPEELDSANVKVGDDLTIRAGNNDFMAKFVERYADLGIGQVGILVDSTGMISVVKNLDYAANELDLKEGKAVAILPRGTSITGKDKPIETYTPTENPNEGQAPMTPPSSVQPQMDQIVPADPTQLGAGGPPVQADYVPAPFPEAQPPSAPSQFAGQVGPSSAPQGSPIAPTPSAPLAPPVPDPAFLNDPFARNPVTNDQMPPDPFASSPTDSSNVQAPMTEQTASPQDQSFAGNPFATPPVAPPAQPAPSVPQESEQSSVQPQTTQAPAQSQWGKPAPSAPVDAPASYFPPPVEQPQATPPEPVPTYADQAGEAPSATPQDPISSLPQNVFDLFKGPEEDSSEDPANPNQDQQ